MLIKNDFYTEKHIIHYVDEINTLGAAEFVAEVYKHQYDFEKSYIPINERELTILLDTVGGSCSAGMAMIDVMKSIPAQIHIIGMGMVASMGAVLLSSGDVREVYPSTEMLIHQPLGSASGQASDILLAAKHIEKSRKTLYDMLAKNTGQPFEQIAHDCERDTVFSAEDALKYGLIDRISSKGDTLWKN